MKHPLSRLLPLCALGFAAAASAAPRNIVFILADDHRFDALGFMGHPFLETPNLDSLAKNGVHLPNAFVTTSLCSPSRAPTGQVLHGNTLSQTDVFAGYKCKVFSGRATLNVQLNIYNLFNFVDPQITNMTPLGVTSRYGLLAPRKLQLSTRLEF